MNKEMSIGYYLKMQREQAKLSQGELAKQTGITQAAISRWEDDLRVPSIESCIKLADFYGISLDELVGRDFLEKGLQ